MKVTIKEYDNLPVKYTPQIVSIKLLTKEEYELFTKIFEAVAWPSLVETITLERIKCMAKNIHEALVE